MIIGLTSSIGCGKTTVGKIFKKLGLKIINADKINHILLKSENVKKEIKNTFGEKIITKNKVNKRKLAKIVFKNNKELKKLEKILHPKIKKTIWNIIEKEKEENFVIDAPLLIESNTHKKIDILIVVKCDKKTQMKRLKQRKYTKKDAIKRIKFQLPLDYKIRLADYIIDSSGKHNNTEKEVRKLWELIKKDW